MMEGYGMRESNVKMYFRATYVQVGGEKGYHRLASPFPSSLIKNLTATGFEYWF